MAGRREDGTGLSTTEAGLHPDTGAEIAAGTETAAVTLLNEISQSDYFLLLCVCLFTGRGHIVTETVGGPSRPTGTEKGLEGRNVLRL